MSPGRVEPASPREKHGDVSWVVSTQESPVHVSLQLLALQLMPSLLARFVTAGVATLHTPPPFGFDPGDKTGTQEVGV